MNKINTLTSNKPFGKIYAEISYVNTLSLGKNSVYYMLINLIGLTF